MTRTTWLRGWVEGRMGYRRAGFQPARYTEGHAAGRRALVKRLRRLGVRPGVHPAHGRSQLVSLPNGWAVRLVVAWLNRRADVEGSSWRFELRGRKPRRPGLRFGYCGDVKLRDARRVGVYVVKTKAAQARENARWHEQVKRDQAWRDADRAQQYAAGYEAGQKDARAGVVTARGPELGNGARVQ